MKCNMSVAKGKRQKLGLDSRLLRKDNMHPRVRWWGATYSKGRAHESRCLHCTGSRQSVGGTRRGHRTWAVWVTYPPVLRWQDPGPSSCWGLRSGS